MDKLKTPLSDLDAGTMVEKFPDESIFFSDWAAEIYAKNTMVGFIDENGEIIEQALLCSCRVLADDADETKIVFKISKGSATAKMIFEILPVVTYSYADDSPARLSIKKGFYSKDLDEILHILKEDPIHVYYENLSFIAGKVLFESRLTISIFPLDNILKIAWPATVNVNKEFWMPGESVARAAGSALSISIHEYILAEVDRDFDAVFYDHGSLEIADIVAFKPGLVRFYHCKKQDSDQPRCSVDDMYEVIGQAVKSVNWANRKFLIQQLITRSDKNGIVSKVRKGTIEGIKSILNEFDNPIIPVEIIIVQPGLKSDNHTGNQVDAFQRINTLLAGAHEYLRAVSSCKLMVMCS